MATSSIAGAWERLPALLQRAAQGKEVVIAGGFGIGASLRPVPKEPGPMSPERLAWPGSVRVTPAPGSADGPELVRRMRGEGY